MLPEMGRRWSPKMQLGAERPHSPTFASHTHSHPPALGWGSEEGAGQAQPPGRLHLRGVGFHQPRDYTQDRGVSQLPNLG